LKGREVRRLEDMLSKMDKDSKIYIAGHRGLVGSALMRKLESEGYSNLVYRTHKELDLTNQREVEEFFSKEKPEYVFLAAAKVGGILANRDNPADFIYQNIMIAANVINSAYTNGVTKLLNLGSSCIYPKMCPQPMKEEHLLTGPLEPTNDAYALAKISAIKMCNSYNKQFGTNFLSLMPTNLYGPHDNFDLQSSHVMPALIRKFHEGKDEVVCWGTGSPKREFLHVDDLASACLFSMNNIDAKDLQYGFLNVGTGTDISIKELAEMIKEITGFSGKIIWDTEKPDGTPRKLLDVSEMKKLGWQAQIELRVGIKQSYDWFTENY
jgi:GDP-L-fucose synthase